MPSSKRKPVKARSVSGSEDEDYKKKRKRNNEVCSKWISAMLFPLTMQLVRLNGLISCVCVINGTNFICNRSEVKAPCQITKQTILIIRHWFNCVLILCHRLWNGVALNPSKKRFRQNRGLIRSSMRTKNWSRTSIKSASKFLRWRSYFWRRRRGKHSARTRRWIWYGYWPTMMILISQVVRRNRKPAVLFDDWLDVSKDNYSNATRTLVQNDAFEYLKERKKEEEIFRACKLMHPT